MNALWQQLMRYKPSFLPAWLYGMLLLLLLLAASVVAVMGLWFVSTQIEFM